MNIKTLSLFLMTLVYFNVSAAEWLTVYRWIDKENIVHFSQHQPTHDDYIEFSMANKQKSTATIDQESSVQDSQPSENESVGSGENNNLNDANIDKCVAAQENINTLQNFDKIQYKDEKGNLKFLGEVEKQRQLAMNTKQAEVYCTD